MGNFNLKNIWAPKTGGGGSIPSNLEQRVQELENNTLKLDNNNQLQIVRHAVDFYENGIFKKEAFVDVVGNGNTNITNKQYVDTKDAQNVKLTGDQSIGGNKTFTQPLTVATPTANTNATTKEYVDNRIKKRVYTTTNTQGNTHTIQPTAGYEIISVMVGRKRNSDGFYFFQYHTNLNFQLFLHSDGTYRIYTQGPVPDFAGEYKIIVVEMKV